MANRKRRGGKKGAAAIKKQRLLKAQTEPRPLEIFRPKRKITTKVFYRSIVKNIILSALKKYLLEQFPLEMEEERNYDRKKKIKFWKEILKKMIKKRKKKKRKKEGKKKKKEKKKREKEKSKEEKNKTKEEKIKAKEEKNRAKEEKNRAKEEKNKAKEEKNKAKEERNKAKEGENKSNEGKNKQKKKRVNVLMYITAHCRDVLHQIIENGSQYTMDGSQKRFTIEDFNKGLNYYDW